MARSSTGKSVARAAATGGGTSYRGQMPVNWYAALVLIVLLGIGSVVLARHNYTKRAQAVPPTVGQTWHAGLAVDICGTAEPALPATASGSSSGLTTTGSGVLLIAPKTSSEAGNNATLGKFASEYATLKLTNTSVMYPGGTKYKNGEKCAKGTPDAGQVGVVRARSWTLSSASKKSGSQDKLVGGKYSTKPADLKLRNAQLITLGFGPSSKPLPKVPSATEVALLQAIEGTSAPETTTTATAPTATTTTTAHHAYDHHDDQAVHHDHHDQTVELMKAVVLVGGEGTRLRPLTLSTPKQMLPIVGVPMIERVLAHLGSHGVDEAILSLGYLPDAFKEAYPDGQAAGIRLTYAVEPEPLDTAGALRFAATYGGIDDTFVVVNGDVLTDLDLGSLIAFHRQSGAEGTIALHPVPDPSAFGVVPTDDDGRVTAFVEKPPRDEAPTNEINAGTYVLEASVLDRISPSGRVSIERETFPAMVRSGVLFARADDGYWLDTGTPAAYLQANRDLVSGLRQGAAGPGPERSGRPGVPRRARARSSGRSSGRRLSSATVRSPKAPVWCAACWVPAR